MFSLFNQISYKTSKVITEAYSTSFTLGIKTLSKELHNPIFAIYGFVRLADEIVDTFHEFDKKKLLDRFREDTWLAIDEGISLNPVLQSFQQVVHQYNIKREMIASFLKSMEMDLYNIQYDEANYDEYIYGSAEVVGLMCLQVFVKGNDIAYERLKPYAQSLGSAFQKVNFLRDMKSDFDERGRVYFPNVDFEKFDNNAKKAIEADIQKDFDQAYIGIMNLPTEAKMGVYLAYVYYLKLFAKIKRTPATRILKQRIRVPNAIKLNLLVQTYFKHKVQLGMASVFASF